MTEKLPIKDFRFLKELPTIDVADDSEVGFIFECDLSYPWEYHEFHNSLPMAAENIHSLHHITPHFPIFKTATALQVLVRKETLHTY